MCLIKNQMVKEIKKRMTCSFNKETKDNVEVWQEISYVGLKENNFEYILDISPIKTYHFIARKLYPEGWKELKFEMYPALFRKTSRDFLENAYSLLTSKEFWENYGKDHFYSDLNALMIIEYKRLNLIKPENKKYAVENESGEMIEVSKEHFDRYSEKIKRKKQKSKGRFK